MDLVSIFRPFPRLPAVVGAGSHGCRVVCLCFQMSLVGLASDAASGENEIRDYAPGQILLLPDSTVHGLSAALRGASLSDNGLTGHSAFDSLSSAHSLQGIVAPPSSPQTTAFFILKFPPETDVPSLAAAYGSLPGIAVAEPNYLLQMERAPAVADALVPLLEPAKTTDSSTTDSAGGRALLVRLAMSDSGLLELRRTIQRDSTQTGLAPFDSLSRILGVHKIALSISAEVLPQGSLLLLVHLPDSLDLDDAARHFLTIPHVISAGSNDEKETEHPVE